MVYLFPHNSLSQLSNRLGDSSLLCNINLVPFNWWQVPAGKSRKMSLTRMVPQGFSVWCLCLSEVISIL